MDMNLKIKQLIIIQFLIVKVEKKKININFFMIKNTMMNVLQNINFIMIIYMLLLS